MTGAPTVACIGGGHGLAATLRAVVPWAAAVTAVVSIADAGGSSGRLRQDLGVAPPGDLRRCLSALADPASVLGGALEHRFAAGDLKEHALGNLLIAGLVDHGLDLEAAVAEVGRMVGARGRVLPASVVAVTLTGTRHSDEGPVDVVEGQVEVQGAAGLRHLAVLPVDAASPIAAVDAVMGADLVVLGPGSLFTSVLAAAVLPAVAEALARTTATRVLAMNLGEQAAETAGLSADDHVRICLDHGVPVDVVLADPRFAPAGDLVPVSVTPVGRPGVAVHDPDLLGAALRDLPRR